MAWHVQGILMPNNAATSFIVSGSALSSHDIIVGEAFSGNSGAGIRIEEVTAFHNPTRYLVRVRSTGNILLGLHGREV